MQVANTIDEVLQPKGVAVVHRRGASMHDHARRAQAGHEHGDQPHAGRLPRRPGDAPRVPRRSSAAPPAPPSATSEQRPAAPPESDALVPDLRPVLFIVGAALLGLAAIMVLPAAVDSFDGSPDWRAFLTALAITAAFGGVLVLGFRQPRATGLTAREGFVLTVLAALGLTLFARCPSSCPRPAGLHRRRLRGDVRPDDDRLHRADPSRHQSHGLLLWRALLHLIGGIGAC